MATRVKNVSRNMVFAIISYLIQIILSFILRRNFIYYFNEEYLGLNSLFSNVISVLSLVELGFGSALVFAMYKPMAEGDVNKSRQLLQFYKKCYILIASIISVCGLLVLPFMDYFRAQTTNVDVNLYIVYLIYLATTVFSYLFAYRRSLLYVNQRKDIESKITIITNIICYLLQLLVVIFIRNYYLYLVVNILSTVISNLMVYFVTQKIYPDYLKKPDTSLPLQDKKSIKSNVYALIFHKIGAVVVYSIDSLVIFLCINASTLGKYSNYLLITNAVMAITSLIIGAMQGSVGNSIASQSPEKNNSLFYKLNFIYMWIISFCAIAVFVLSDPFIDVVLTKGDAKLTFDLIIILSISLNFYFSASRSIVNVFKDGAGLFRPDRLKPIFECAVNLVSSIVLARFIGLAGVVIGTILSNVLVAVWVEPKVLFKHYFKMPVHKYFLKYAWFFISFIVSGVATYFTCSLVAVGGIFQLILRGIICLIVSNIVLFICLAWLPEFKECFNWGISIFKKLIHGHKNNTVLEVSGVDVDKDGIEDIPGITILMIEEPNDTSNTTEQTLTSNDVND